MRYLSPLIASIFLLSLSAGCKKSEKKPKNCAAPTPEKKQVVVPKFWTTRTILELQLRLARAIKVQDWPKTEKWLLGGLIKDVCPARGLKHTLAQCLQGMETQTATLLTKKLTKCPSGRIPSWSSKKCPVTAWCEKITLIMENSEKKKFEVTFTELSKIAGKWWVMGPVSCNIVP